jgi:WD40 repeat protein/tetratricopeptide (TPR) repeat protein
VAYHPDGRRLAWVGREDLRLYDAKTGQETFALPAPNRGVDTVGFSPDGERLLVTTSDHFREPDKHSSIPGKVTAYRAPSLQPVLTFRQHNDEVQGLVFTKDRRRLYSAGDRTVKVWEVRPGGEGHTGRPHANFDLQLLQTRILAMHPDGTRLVVAAGWGDSKGDGVRILDPSSGRVVQELPDYPGQVRAAAFSPNGRLLVTVRHWFDKARPPAGSPEDATVWDVAAGRKLLTFAGHARANELQLHDVAFHPDGRRVATASAASVRVWEAETGKELFHLPNHSSVAFSPDGRLLAAAGKEQVTIWDAASGREKQRLPRAGVTRLVFRRDSRCLAGLVAGAVVLWDVVSGQVLLSIRETQVTVEERHALSVFTDDLVLVPPASMAFSPEGERLGVGFVDGTIRVYELPLSASAAGEPFARIGDEAALYFNDLAAQDVERGRILAACRVPAARAALEGARDVWEALARDLPDVRFYKDNLYRIHRELARLHQAEGRINESKAASDRAAELQARLGDVREVPEMTPEDAAARGVMLVAELRQQGRLPAARETCDGLIRLLDPLVRQQPGSQSLLRHLLDAHGMRAMTLVELKDPKTALADWDLAIELSGGRGPAADSLRVARAATLVRAGEHARATAEADALAASLPMNAPNVTQEVVNHRYSLARVHGRAVTVVREDEKLPAEERNRLADKYAARALQLLQQAEAAGYFRTPGTSERLGRDKDFDAVRERPEFQQFVEKLGKK